jgi:hypothetical protein
MAMDTHCVLRPPWYCYAHEAAQLCVLYVSSKAQNLVNADLGDNGHLSEEYKMRAALQNKLKQLDTVAPAETPSAITPKFSTSLDYLDHKPKASDLNQRRQSRTFTNEDGASNIDQVAAAIESGEPLDLDQIQIFERIIKWEIGKFISIPMC